jgi:3-methylcrotonyl-CoA carboxylase alpha subunit
MFNKVLIANRGEIAIRVARTCRRMGLAVAGVHSEADRDAPHVRDIGESALIGAAPASESYLVIERIVEAARRLGADAVHPGYGFLAENAEFAAALEREGIVFIGPTAQTLRDFGDKAAAKRLASAAGVPTIPGSPGASADPERVAEMVKALGMPVLLKAAAGGGGKGIRVLHLAEHLADEIAAAMRESASAFGDASLLVERYLPHGRHVEVQILGDGQGHVLHLWERECSLQRRYQKVVEEAPALPLPGALRQRMLDAAVALGRQVRYRALGTVEFLVVGDDFHFLEVNPRLQVEHPVTECVTRLDLVELQIRAAAGEPLTLQQDQVRCDGHAIEARLYAEDPDHGFVPSAGTLHRLELPHRHARIESGVRRGSVITAHYDPMLAKIIVGGADRAQAIQRLREALARTRLAGVASNLGFLEALFRSPAVTDAIPDTGTIGRMPGDAVGAVPAWRAAAAHVAAAWSFRCARDDNPSQPAAAWTALTHWRLGAAPAYRPLRPQFELHTGNGVLRATVGTDRGRPGTFHVRAGAVVHDIEIDGDPGDDDWRVAVDGVAARLAIGRDGAAVWLSDGRHTEIVRVQPALARDGTSGAGAGAALLAPLTGKVLEVRVSDGDAVLAGQVLMVIESMKMEMRITAPHAGVASAVGAMVGTMVERGAVLVKVRAEELTA